MKVSNLAQEIHNTTSAMSRSERRIARVLHSTNFRAGLGPVASLASKANVSGPTVIRFTSKLGYASYREFQEAVKVQFNERIESPLTLYERISIRQKKADLPAVAESILECVKTTFGMVDQDEFEKIAGILGDKRRKIYTIGGQASGMFANLLAARLFQLRPSVQALGAQYFGFSQEEQLPFLGSRDVLVAFDFRRYQESTIFFADTAAQQRATIILVTDTWLSPIADFAQHVLVTSPDGNWPYDFFTPCMALLDALPAVVLSNMDPKTVGKRIQLCEQYSHGLLGGRKRPSEYADGTEE